MSNGNSSFLKKSNTGITASSFYSRGTLSTPSVNTKTFSNASVDTLVTFPLEEEEEGDNQTNFISNENTVTYNSYSPKKDAEIDIISPLSPNPSVTSTIVEKGNLKKSNSILRKSLSFLTRSETKKLQSQLIQVHRYTIYDDEKGEFIELVEEEWDGDGPPPRNSTDSQKKGALMLDKALPSLPEPSPENKKETPIMKFNKWLKNRYPYVNKYKSSIIISLILLFIILLIIIILAATGAFAKSKNKEPDSKTGDDPTSDGKPGLSMNGKGDGTYYDPGVGLGACGELHTADEFIGAMNAQQFGVQANPNDAPICGMCVIVTGPKGSVKIKIVDKCPTCKFGDIDLSPAAYNVIGDETQGRIPITWEGC